MNETLGALAHRGGLLVRRPELTVGVVQATARTTGLSLELIARLPLDRRDASQRQREIRTRRVTVAPRVLLPEFDEGEDLRLGWLDDTGRARWVYPTSGSSWSGDSYEGVDGPRYRMTYDLPPVFGSVSIVLAWPEIGFPEAVVTLPLPDRETVEAATTSIWTAPLDPLPVPALTHHDQPHQDALPIETGTVLAAPRVLHRNENAAVVLSRVTAVGAGLSLETFAVSRAERTPPPRVAIVAGGDAYWLNAIEGMSTGGPNGATFTQEYVADRPAGDSVDLVATWPGAGLPDTLVRINRE